MTLSTSCTALQDLSHYIKNKPDPHVHVHNVQEHVSHSLTRGNPFVSIPVPDPPLSCSKYLGPPESLGPLAEIQHNP